MKNVLVITFSNLKTDARVKRQLSFLKSNADFKITVASNDGEQPDGMEAIKLKPMRLSLVRKIFLSFLLLFRFYSRAYSFMYGQNLHFKNRFDLIVANDIEALPLAFSLKGNAKVLFDAHEYAPRHFEDRLGWRIFFQGFNKYLCEKYIPKVDAMITVGKVIADEYFKHYGIKPIVITNAPSDSNLLPQKVDPNHVKLIHQGSANPSRKLELMIQMMDYLDERFHLDLMLIKPLPSHRLNYAYHKKLENLIKGNNRIRLVPPTPPEELVQALNNYDIGIILIPPVNFNYKNTLPNKFFECIQARIALAIAPTPEIAMMTHQFNIGVVSSDFTPQTLAKEIALLTSEKIDELKKNTIAAAKELNAENNKKIFNEIITSILPEG